MLCRHVAAVLAHYEKVHGPSVFVKTQEEIRLEEEEKRRRELEKKREKEQKELEGKYFPVGSLLDGEAEETDSYFHPSACTGDFVISYYEVKKLHAIEEGKSGFVSNGVEFALSEGEQKPSGGTASLPDRISWKKFDTAVSPEGQTLKMALTVCGYDVKFELSEDAIEKCSCECGKTRSSLPYYSRQKDKPEKVFCVHALIAWRAARERIRRENPGDATDMRGDAFLRMLTKDLTVTEKKPDKVISETRKEDIVLAPRIVRDSAQDDARLSFLIGRAGERSYVVRDMEQLTRAYDQGESYSISKKTEFDFSAETITQKSAVWLAEMRRHAEANAAARKAMSRYTSYYMPSGLSASAIDLKGALLDRVYDNLEGNTVLYIQSKAEYVIPVRSTQAHLRLRLIPEKRGGSVLAVKVHGHVPKIEKGAHGSYILDPDRFCRLSEDDTEELSPLKKLADPDGDIDFRIGKKHLAEFYYRVLPKFQSGGMVQIKDEAQGELADAMPEEAAFTFYMDISGDEVTCRPYVRYGEAPEFPLMTGPGPARKENPSASVLTASMRDLVQEKRVESIIRKYFPEKDLAEGYYRTKADDTTLPWILLSGVDNLSRFGEVKGSEAFRNVEVRPVPTPKIQVSLDADLLNLSVVTTDMDADDLLALLESYRLRKKWHRLKSGNFISLEKGTESLGELSSLSESLGISLEDAVRGSVSVPKYRAVYVDRMLEEHDRVASSKNRPFRSLIRSFRTITDSDFEVPEEVSEKLRPYQNYGYQWLRTLAATGFGGILADEMGLGKTLQMLSCIEGMKDDGERKPFLVVCPASLVYNWKEEAKKFTPSLRVLVLAGSKAERRAVLAALREECAALKAEHGTLAEGDNSTGNAASADLYITSYDLCKRDITMYEGIHFAGVVLDEAQFAKNQNTAVAMSLKTLKADSRFALTGTPIENRLSELWNIFDFLMPGFLYTSQEFRQRFELPIMKEKNAETANRLSQMTKPFILRRKKEDVLKDLPEKLEETQAAQMDTEQRHLYDAEVVRIRKLLEEGQYSQERFKVLAGITRLRQICCDPSLLFENYHGKSAKREACVDLIERSIDAGHRILLFSQFTSMLGLLKKDLDSRKITYYEITGSTSKKERIELADAFNENDVPVFLISLRAGGTGLNLTGADVVILYDPWWNLAVMNQAADRAHRIGQTKKVTVVKLIMADTIEEKIIDLQQSKKDLADQILSGKSDSLAAFTDEEVLKLLE